MVETKNDVDKQIARANNLSNALLSGLLATRIDENKRNVKVNTNLRGLLEAVQIFYNEISRLISLKTGKISDVIDAKQNSDNQLQITVIEKLLKKVDETLKQHVKYSDPEIVSKDELDMLTNQQHLIESIQKKIHNLPNSTDCMKEHLDTLNQIHANHQRISKSVTEAQSKVGGLQGEAVVSSSDMTYYSN